MQRVKKQSSAINKTNMDNLILHTDFTNNWSEFAK
jgi:hypothetical protein